MILEDKIISFFKYFNSKISGTSQDYEASESEKQTVRKFIYALSDDIAIQSIGFDWLFHYFCFQFSYWNDLDTGYSKRIQMTWVLGQKAYERYKDRRDDFRFLNEMFAIEKDISKSELKEITDVEVERDYRDLHAVEDVERGRYHNELEGFAHCVLTTTLHNSNSEWCQTCEFAEECKQALRQEYPKIYRERGYAKQKSIEF